MGVQEIQQKRSSKPAAGPSMMSMEEMSSCLAKAARDAVQRALMAEIADVGVRAWAEEAEWALGGVLRDKKALHSVDSDRVQNALLQALKEPSPPDKEEVAERAAEVGHVLATAWLQFLTFALGRRDFLRLGADLCPARGDVQEELWNALHSSVNALPVRADEVSDILQKFAEQVIAHKAEIELPSGLVLEVLREPTALYVARRK